jgi:uncharacterized protein YdeI (YjbR/CyaY-like superfamily)
MGTQDPRVDAYIDESGPFAQPILRHLREVVHAAAPGIDETMKWGIPHFVQGGIVCSMAAFKQHCTFGFWKHALVVGGGGGRERDAMGSFGRITSLSDLPSRKVLSGYVREAVRLNEAGVKLPKATAPKHPKKHEMPEVLRAALARDAKARIAFERFTPSQRYEYVEWIAEAKREDTRERRLATALEWITEGRTRHWKYQKC